MVDSQQPVLEANPCKTQKARTNQHGPTRCSPLAPRNGSGRRRHQRSRREEDQGTEDANLRADQYYHRGPCHQRMHQSPRTKHCHQATTPFFGVQEEWDKRNHAMHYRWDNTKDTPHLWTLLKFTAWRFQELRV